MPLAGLRVGYLPCAKSLLHPGDRRRFAFYAARRGIEFEIADPTKAYDVVVLSELADLSVWHQYIGGKIVFDLIDSYLAIPRDDLRGRLRGTAKFVTRQSRHLQADYWHAVELMCRRANAVVCTTLEQQRDIKPYCANVHIILDAHGMLQSGAKTQYRSESTFKLLWEGMPQNLAPMRRLEPVLKRLQQRHTLELHLITDLEFGRFMGRYGRIRTEDLARNLCAKVILHPWQEKSFAATAINCDLAVVPLDLDDPFSAGKPENKLLLFWKLGIPAVVSATPAYARAMQSVDLAMACGSGAEWEATLDMHITDEAARRHAGEIGKRYADIHFSEDVLLGRWDALFRSLN